MAYVSYDPILGEVDLLSRFDAHVLKTVRLVLNDVADRSTTDRPAKIADNVRLAGGDYKANLSHPGNQHALQQVFADSPRALAAPVLSRTHRQQLFRKSQRLNSSSHACSGYNAPGSFHMLISNK